MGVRAALAAHAGQTKAPEVAAAVDALATLNPTASPARAADVLLGQWKHINSPEYPGMLGLDADGKPRYTLGRLAFNLFEPKELECSISDILNPLRAREDDASVIDYAIEIPISYDHAGTLVHGRLLNFAECGVVSDDRLSVRFLGGKSP